jgi:hypothetical protein
MIGPVGVENLFHAGRPAAKQAFQMADDMAAKGHTRDEIWEATANHFRRHDPEFAGVHYGPDGLPRAELSDAGVPWAGGTPENMPVHGVDLTEPEKAWPHATLYQAYPEMGNRGLIVSNPPPSATNTIYGSYDPRSKSLAINLNKIYPPESVIVHESQHGVQGTEGMLTGSHWRNFPVNSVNVQKTLKDPSLDPKLANDMIDVAQRHMGFKGDTMDELNKFAEEKGMIPSVFAMNLSAKIPRDKYNRTYGETEARNAQTRYHMNAEERRQTPPWKTFDYPENKLITEY